MLNIRKQAQKNTQSRTNYMTPLIKASTMDRVSHGIWCLWRREASDWGRKYTGLPKREAGSIPFLQLDHNDTGVLTLWPCSSYFPFPEMQRKPYYTKLLSIWFYDIWYSWVCSKIANLGFHYLVIVLFKLINIFSLAFHFSEYRFSARRKYYLVKASVHKHHLRFPGSLPAKPAREVGRLTAHLPISFFPSKWTVLCPALW